jgi:hypothetical protein
MTHKISMLLMVVLALAMAGIGGAVTASAAATPAELAWSPTTRPGAYIYGPVAPGTTKSVTFTLTNMGREDSGWLRISLLRTSVFTITQDGCTGRNLGANQSCTDTVQYAPQNSGQSESATLRAMGTSTHASLYVIGQPIVGGTPTPNLTLRPGTFLDTSNGTKSYQYVLTHATTFTVTNSGTSASEPLHIECNESTRACLPPFTLTHDTCTNTSLAANGGSCIFQLEVTFTNGCSSGTLYRTDLGVVGTNVTYITVEAYATCPS